MYTHQPLNYQCPLCLLAKGEETEFNSQDNVVFDNKKVMAFISPKWWPNNPGHVVVIPHQHFENIYDIPDEVLTEINLIGKRIALVMKESYNCDGISFRQHNEPAGDQDVWHFHLHVFPRWKDDKLYLNYLNSRYVSAEESKPYADKLREKIVL